MPMKEFEKHSVEDLHTLVADKREELRAVRFGAAGSRSRNTREGRNIRKTIARALTELRARSAGKFAGKGKTA